MTCRRSRYLWQISHINPRSHPVLVIEDQDRGDDRSVTNDVRQVIEDFKEHGISVDDYRVIYRDSMGRWDGIATNRGAFVGFIGMGSTDREVAIAVAATIANWRTE